MFEDIVQKKNSKINCKNSLLWLVRLFILSFWLVYMRTSWKRRKLYRSTLYRELFFDRVFLLKWIPRSFIIFIILSDIVCHISMESIEGIQLNQVLFYILAVERNFSNFQSEFFSRSIIDTFFSRFISVWCMWNIEIASN